VGAVGAAKSLATVNCTWLVARRPEASTAVAVTRWVPFVRLRVSSARLHAVVPLAVRGVPSSTATVTVDRLRLLRADPATTTFAVTV
jgi:hypothetical protein